MWSVTIPSGESNRMATSELAQLGEEEDQYTRSTSTMREKIKAMTGFDIMADDAGTQFKDIYDIVVGIGEKWGELDDITHASILEMIGGKRGVNSLAAVMNNIDRVKEIYATAQGAEGSAMKENEAYQRSVQASIEKAKAQLQELASDFLSSDLLKGLIDAGRVLIDIADQIVSKFSTLQTIIGGFTAGSLFKGLVLKDPDAVVPNLFKSVARRGFDIETSKMLGKNLLSAIDTRGLAGGSEILRNGFGDIKKAASALDKISDIKADDKLKLLSMAFEVTTDEASKATEAIVGVSNGITGITKIDKAIKSVKNFGLGFVDLVSKFKGFSIAAAAVGIGTAIYGFYKDYKKNLREMGEEGAKTWDNSKKSLDDYINRYTELQTKLTQEGLSQGEQLQIKQQLYELQKEITAEYGNSASGIDLINGKLDEELNKLRGISQELAKQNLDNAIKGFEETTKSYRNTTSPAVQLTLGTPDSRQQIQDIVDDIDGLHIKEDVEEFSRNNWLHFDIDANNVRDELNILTEFKNSINDLYLSAEDGANKDAFKELRDGIDGFVEDLKKSVEADAPIFDSFVESILNVVNGNTALSELKDASNELTNALLEGSDEAIDTAYKNYQDKYSDMSDLVSAGMSTSYAKTAKLVESDFWNYINSNVSDFDESMLDRHYMEEIIRDTKKDVSDKSIYNGLVESYEEAVNEITAMNKDMSQTVFGNIDLNDRQVLEWNKQNLSKYSKQLESWGIEADEFADTISTVIGMSNSFGEKPTEIAFSPLLQTDHGAELLSRDTVVDYINSILKNVSRDANGDYVIEDILKRDAVENGGKGLIAAVGPEAFDVGEYMHFVSQAIEAQKEMQELLSINLEDVSDDNPYKNLNKASAIKKHADAIKKAGLDIVDVQKIFDEGIHDTEVSKDLFALAQDFGIVFENNIPKDEAIYNAFLGALTSSNVVFDSTGATIQSYNSNVTDMVDQIDKAVASISTLTSILSESASATGVSADNLASFRAMFGDEANKAIEYTTNGIHINQQAVLDLQKSYNEKTKSAYIQSLSQQLIELSNVNKDIADAQLNGNDSLAAGLMTKRDAIKKNIQDLRDSIAEYQGAMSDFNMWTQAKNAGSERSMYEEAFGAYESYGEQLDLGWLDNGVREWIHMMTGMENAATASYSEIVEAYDGMVEKLSGTNFRLVDFYDLEDGKLTTDGIDNFFQAVNDAFGNGFASLGEDGWSFNFSDANIEAMVARWNIGPELIEAIVRASLEHGAHGQFGGDDYSSLYYNKDLAAGDVNYLMAHTSSDWKFSGLDLDDKSVESITAGIDLVKGFLESAEGAKADPSTIVRAQNLLSYYNDLLEDVETNGKSSQIKAHQAETAARVKMQQEKDEKEAAQKEIEAQKQAAIDQLEAQTGNTTALENNTTALENLLAYYTLDEHTTAEHEENKGKNGSYIWDPDSSPFGQMRPTVSSKPKTQGFKEKELEPKGNGGNLSYTRPDVIRKRNNEIEKDNRYDSETNRRNVFNKGQSKTEWSSDDIENLSVDNLEVDTVSGAAPVNKNDTISTGEGDKKESKSKKKSDESATKTTEETADNVGEIENNVAEMMAAIKAANEGKDYLGFENPEILKQNAIDYINKGISPEQVYQSAGIEPPTDSSPITKEVNFVANDEEVKEATEEAEKPVEQPVEQTITQRVNAVLNSSNLDTSGTIQASTEDMQAAVEIVANVVGQEELEELKDAEDNLYDKTIQAIAQAIGQGKVQNLIDVVNSLRPNTVTAKANTEGTEAVQNLKRELAGLKDKTITIKTIRRIEEQNAKGSGGSGPNTALPAYNGTAHAQGTAHAGGKWGLERDEDNALINELGEEIVVRGDRWFTVNNGKPAITSLKRDDIVFNHKQSEELLKRGYVSSGHGKMRGRSYANGKNNDLESIGEQIGKGIVQYLGSGNGGGYQPGRTKTKKKEDTQKQDSGGGGNGNGGGGNGGGRNGNGGGGNGGGNTDKSKSNADDLIDWIEILLERLAKSLERLKTAADLLDKYTSKIAKYNAAIAQVQTNIKKNEQAEAKYRQKANSIKIFEKDKKKDAAYKRKIEEGDLSIENISDENVRKKIEEYQKWFEKATQCKDTITDLRLELVELSQTKLDSVVEYFDKFIDRLSTMSDYYEATSDYMEAVRGWGDAGAQRSSRTYMKQQLSQLEKQYAAYLKEYNAQIAKGAKNGGIDRGSTRDMEARKQLADIKTSIVEAKTAIENVDDTIREIGNQRTEAVSNPYNAYSDFLSENANRWQAESDLFEAYNGRQSVNMLRKSALDTNTRAHNLEDLINEYEKTIKANLSEDIWKVGDVEYTNAIAELEKYRAELANTKKEVAELNKQIIDTNWSNWKKGLEVLNHYQSSINSIVSLLDEFNTFNSKTAKITEYGQSQVNMRMVEMNDAREEVAKYVVALNKLNEEYANGQRTQFEYEQKYRELYEGELSAAQKVQSARKSILDTVRRGIEAETKAMSDLISKRKEALQRQKEADDYARNMRDRNKEINKIRQQIAALSGDTTEETRAKILKLQADLQDKQQELEDTQRDHEYSVITQGLDDELEKFREVQDEKTEALTSSLEYQDQIIKDALSVTTADFKNTVGVIQSLADEYGISIPEALVSGFGGIDFAKLTGLDTLPAKVEKAVDAIEQASQKIHDASQKWGSGEIVRENDVNGHDSGANADRSNTNNDTIEDRPTLVSETITKLQKEADNAKASVKKTKDAMADYKKKMNEAKTAMEKAEKEYNAIKDDKSVAWSKRNAAKTAFNSARSHYHASMVNYNSSVGAYNQAVSTYNTKKSSLAQYDQTAAEKMANYSTAKKATEPYITLKKTPLRQKADAKGKELLEIPAGKTVQFTGKKQNNYYQVTYGGKTGWAYVNNLERYIPVEARQITKTPKTTTKLGPSNDPIKKTTNKKTVKLGYAKGTKSSKKGLSLTDEEGVGTEAILTKKGVLRQLDAGTMIFNKAQRENLWEMSKINATSLLRNVAAKTGGFTIQNTYGSLLTVNGNVDKEALPELQTILDLAVDKMRKSLSSTMIKNGFAKR